MKVILNDDVPNLGELGDVKDVATGYARNYLLPRRLVKPFNASTEAEFERRRKEIEDRKAKKRADSADLHTKLEAEEFALEMPAGQSGKLFGAVSNATIAEVLLKKGFNIDRKKIEVPGRVIKSAGNYKILIHLYEKDEATIHIAIKGIVEKAKTPEKANARKPRRDRNAEANPADANKEAPAAEESAVKEN